MGYRQAIDNLFRLPETVYWIRLTLGMRSLLKDRLKTLREQAGFTLRDAASKLNKSPGYISRIEGRGEIPSAELLCEMAELYRTDVEELMELAKKSQLDQTRIGIEEKHGNALRLYRKNKEKK